MNSEQIKSKNNIIIGYENILEETKIDNRANFEEFIPEEDMPTVNQVVTQQIQQTTIAPPVKNRKPKSKDYTCEDCHCDDIYDSDDEQLCSGCQSNIKKVTQYVKNGKYEILISSEWRDYIQFNLKLFNKRIQKILIEDVGFTKQSPRRYDSDCDSY